MDNTTFPSQGSISSSNQTFDSQSGAAAPPEFVNQGTFSVAETIDGVFETVIYEVCECLQVFFFGIRPGSVGWARKGVVTTHRILLKELRSSE